jgi:hypothetical protein
MLEKSPFNSSAVRGFPATKFVLLYFFFSHNKQTKTKKKIIIIIIPFNMMSFIPAHKACSHL